MLEFRDNPLAIRPPRPDDADAIEPLPGRSYPVLLARDYAPELLAEALPEIGRARSDLIAWGSYFVAEGPEGLQAEGGWTRATPGGREGPAENGHIRHVVTDAACLRRGIGCPLLRHVPEHVERAGLRRMHRQSRLTAVPFYASLGFSSVAEIEL
jgi:ribosomal protein S18 acetylase RimI-like enzyme